MPVGKSTQSRIFKLIGIFVVKKRMNNKLVDKPSTYSDTTGGCFNEILIIYSDWFVSPFYKETNQLKFVIVFSFSAVINSHVPEGLNFNINLLPLFGRIQSVRNLVDPIHRFLACHMMFELVINIIQYKYHFLEIEGPYFLSDYVTKVLPNTIPAF